MGTRRQVPIIAAALAAFLWAAPVSAQQAVILFGCLDRAHAEAVAGEMTVKSVGIPDARWISCHPIQQMVEDMTDAPAPFMGPLDDWEGDTFALYEVNGGYLVVYWLNGYSPASAEL